MRDLRKYARQTRFRSLVGLFFLLFIVGDGLIFMIYGPSAAVSGLFCMGIGLAPLLLIWILFLIIDWIVKKANE
ncbi:MAG: hypothetical protein OEY93_06005 [Anaerolineae bacterium]|nr:hypothetical protein [Anaerolineae bacterium]